MPCRGAAKTWQPPDACQTEAGRACPLTHTPQHATTHPMPSGTILPILRIGSPLRPQGPPSQVPACEHKRQGLRPRGCAAAGLQSSKHPCGSACRASHSGPGHLQPCQPVQQLQALCSLICRLCVACTRLCPAVPAGSRPQPAPSSISCSSRRLPRVHNRRAE